MDPTQKLKRIIVKLAKCEINEDCINDDSKLIGDFAFDSLSLVQMIVEIEIQFDIELDDGDLDLKKLTKFGSLCEIVATKLLEAINSRQGSNHE